MKFVKGAIVGSMITMGAVMMYVQPDMNKMKKMITKKGKKIINKFM